MTLKELIDVMDLRFRTQRHCDPDVWWSAQFDTGNPGPTGIGSTLDLAIADLVGHIRAAILILYSNK